MLKNNVTLNIIADDREHKSEVIKSLTGIENVEVCIKENRREKGKVGGGMQVRDRVPEHENRVLRIIMNTQINLERVSWIVNLRALVYIRS